MPELRLNIRANYIQIFCRLQPLACLVVRTEHHQTLHKHALMHEQWTCGNTEQVVHLIRALWVVFSKNIRLDLHQQVHLPPKLLLLFFVVHVKLFENVFGQAWVFCNCFLQLIDIRTVRISEHESA